MKKVLTNTNYRVIIKKKKEADILMRFNNIPTKVIELIELLNSNDFDAYIVGGCFLPICIVKIKNIILKKS